MTAYPVTTTCITQLYKPNNFILIVVIIYWPTINTSAFTW